MNKLILILYLSIGLLINFGAADKSETQIFYLQILNSFSLIYFVFNWIYNKQTNNLHQALTFNNYSFISLLVFLVWSSFSVINSINISESFRNLTYVFSYTVAFFVIIKLVNELESLRFIRYSFLALFIIELLVIYIPYISDYIISDGNIILRSSRYSGLTGNVNVASYSILLKFPIIYYLIINTKRNYLQYFYLVLIILASYLISNVLVTRSAVISMVLLSILTLFSFRWKSLSKSTSISFLKFSVYLIIPIIVSISLNIFQSQNDNTSDIVDRISNLGTESDQSSSQRISFYKNGINTFFNNPFLGVGTGNWKLTSLEDYTSQMNGYTVPYHVHNDFIETAAETGLLGLLIFIVFLGAPFFLYLKTKKFKNVFSVFLLLSLSVYLLDSFFNFPFSRPIQAINLIFILSCFWSLNKDLLNVKVSYRANKALIILFLLFSPLGLYSSYKLYISSTQQYFLLGQFNANKFEVPLDEVEKYEMDYPNISATTMPMKTLKGLYYIKEERFDEAIKLFKDAKKENPFLPVNDTYIGYSYHLKGVNDSALYYSKRAFEKQVSNPIHFAHYMISLNNYKDTLSMRKAFEDIKKTSAGSQLVIDKIFYLAMAQIMDKDESRNIVNKVQEDLLNTDDVFLKANLYILNFGQENVIKADSLYNSGLEHFNNKNFDSASKDFEQASKLNPLEIPYFSNAANAYLQLSDFDKVFEFTNYIINNSKSPVGKAHYINALAYYEMGNFFKACEQIKLSSENGFKSSQRLIDALCR